MIFSSAILRSVGLSLILAGVGGFAANAGAAENGSEAVIAVIHIDVMPQYTEAASALLDRFRRDSLRESGAVRIEVLQELGHSNHFTLVERWANGNDYEAHNIAAFTRHFRDALQPMLGSPFDERLHRELPVNR